MLNRYLKAFTLVEMLVALAVSSIIIIASYASYDLVATQYRKNIDIADMHTSGRAIMRIIERDIRMAGFEYRDKDAKVTYGAITLPPDEQSKVPTPSVPLNIDDSGNECCDKVRVIYDYFDEDTKKAERIRIRYWVEPHTSNKGFRYRLYKQKDILGQNKKILAKPILGKKDVMADYIEDFQIVNVKSNSDLFVYDGRSSVVFFNLKTKGRGSINIGRGGIEDMTFGSDGLLYLIGSSSGLIVIDTASNSVKTSFSIGGGCTAIAFGPDNLLYLLCSSKIKVIDPVKKIVKTSFSIGGGCTAIAFGPDGLLYSLCSSSVIKAIDTTTNSVKSSFSVGFSDTKYYKSEYFNVMDFSPNGLLYLLESKPGSKPAYIVVDVNTGAYKGGGYTGGVSRYSPDIAVDSNGLLYLVNNNPYRNSWITVINTFSNVMEPQIPAVNWRNPSIAIKTNITGQESLVTINLTLRTKNQYGKDRQFKKQDYHAGNYKLDKTDKYKRDTFSSTVLVRNLAL